MNLRHRLRINFIYIILRIAIVILYVLPIKAAVYLGGRIGVMLFYLLRKYRFLTIENLNIAFSGEKSSQEIFDIAKSVFENLGKNAAEVANLAKINKFNIDRFVDAYGIEKIDHALGDKKGVIALCCHLGNWELQAAYFGIKGYPSNAIIRPLRDERFDRLINSLRRSKNINVIPRSQSFRKILSVLKDNQILGILPDQDIDSVDGVFVDFFGRKAYTPTGPVVLAMASGSPIIPVYNVRQPDGRHKLVVDDPVILEITGDREKDIVVNTQKWSTRVEKYIRENPTQWVWMHKRWKTQKAHAE